jgi:hypothetical protein
MKLFRVNTDGKFIRYAERDFKEGNQEEVLEFWLEYNPAYILEDENALIKNDIDADKKARVFAILSSIVERITLQLKEDEEEK